MTAARSLVVDVDDDTMSIIDRVAQRRGMSNRQFASEAVRRAAKDDADFDAFVQEGIDAADRGDLIGQDEMEAWFEARVRERSSR